MDNIFSFLKERIIFNNSISKANSFLHKRGINGRATKKKHYIPNPNNQTISITYIDNYGMFCKIGNTDYIKNEIDIYPLVSSFLNVPQLISVTKTDLYELKIQNLKTTCTLRRFKDGDKMIIISTMIKIIDSMYTNGFIHGDLSLDNILIDSKHNMYIIDFGSSFFVNEKSTKLYSGSPYNQLFDNFVIEDDAYSAYCLLKEKFPSATNHELKEIKNRIGRLSFKIYI